MFVHMFLIWRILGGENNIIYNNGTFNNILEYNPETEEWQEIGTMKKPRYSHAVTLVTYEDYAEWCIWKSCCRCHISLACPNFYCQHYYSDVHFLIHPNLENTTRVRFKSSLFFLFNELFKELQQLGLL